MRPHTAHNTTHVTTYGSHGRRLFAVWGQDKKDRVHDMRWIEITDDEYDYIHDVIHRLNTKDNVADEG